jgi:signal transduction histidine kinase
LEGHSPGQEVDELLRVLKTEVTRLNGVLETFRDFAAFRSLSRQPTDVVGLIDKVVRLVRPQADLQKVCIAVEGSEPPAAPVSLDATKFEQVLLNLIINGLEAMPDGGKLTIRTRVAGEELHMDVVDTGCGIPPTVQPRIFDPYFTTKSDGAGMGLAWSEKVIQQHHGHIEFATGPKGTTFKVTIPVSHEMLP